MKDTVSFETAKKLISAGINLKKSYFFYDGKGRLQTCRYMVTPAPALHELLPLMPKVIWGKDDRGEFSFYLSIDDDFFYVGYFDNCLQEWFREKTIRFENPADACAELLLWLKENKHL